LADNLSQQSQFDKAMEELQKIPTDSELYGEAQSKVMECIRQKHQHQLDLADNLSQQSQFDKAMEELQKIPTDSELYGEAQSKLTECLNKIEEERQKRRAEAGGRAIEVIEVTEVNKLVVEYCEPINARIILVKMKLENTSKQTGNFMFSQFQLIDCNEFIYNELTDTTYLMWRQKKGFGTRADEYYPGEIRTDVAAFRVAPTASNFTLKWKDKQIKLWI
jgi:chaperonin cofactor prefoldin